jgi:hypothetical protein
MTARLSFSAWFHQLAVPPTPLTDGLIDNPDPARQAAEFIGRPDVPAEPVTCRPWLLVAYDTAGPASGHMTFRLPIPRHGQGSSAGG